MSIDGDGPVCVLGFPRSGTSLTMRVLNLMGVELGPEADLLPPTDAENPQGYWESRSMLDLNDEILATLGGDWWHPLPAAPGWERNPELEPLRERARTLLEEKFASATTWGWKDPRTTLTLPFWRELVPNARYVICMRNPVDAISSLQRRPEPSQPIGAWGDLWMDYTTRALSETRGQSRLIVFYEDYLRDGGGQIARLASFLGLDPAEVAIPESGPLREVDVNLRHHSTSALELAAAWGISPTARMLFLALRAAESLRGAVPSAPARHDDALSEAIERLAPMLLEEHSTLKMYADAASERLELVKQLEQVANERLELVHEHEATAVERLRALEAATERIGVLEAELDSLRRPPQQSTRRLRRWGSPSRAVTQAGAPDSVDS